MAEDIKTYDGADAVTAITITGATTGISILVGMALTGVGEPVVVIGVGIVVSVGLDYAKKKIIGH